MCPHPIPRVHLCIAGGNPANLESTASGSGEAYLRRGRLGSLDAAFGGLAGLVTANIPVT